MPQSASRIAAGPYRDAGRRSLSACREARTSGRGRHRERGHTPNRPLRRDEADERYLAALSRAEADTDLNAVPRPAYGSWQFWSRYQSGSDAQTTQHRRDRRYAHLISGSRTTPIEFDADLLAELRAEEPGKGDRELLEDLAVRRLGIATARRTRARFNLTEEEATELALRAVREVRAER